jgi:DNA-binding XRE family transcriptional regulator
VAILIPIYFRSNPFQIYLNLSSGARFRHFWVGAVKGWRISFHKIITSANYSMLLLMYTKDSFEQAKFMIKKTKVLNLFGEKVRELRKERGLSQEQLAFDADLHRTYIGMIERAEKNVTLINIEKIAKALKVNIKDLFN